MNSTSGLSAPITTVAVLSWRCYLTLMPSTSSATHRTSSGVLMSPSSMSSWITSITRTADPLSRVTAPPPQDPGPRLPLSPWDTAQQPRDTICSFNLQADTTTPTTHHPQATKAMTVAMVTAMKEELGMAIAMMANSGDW